MLLKVAAFLMSSLKYIPRSWVPLREMENVDPSVPPGVRPPRRVPRLLQARPTEEKVGSDGGCWYYRDTYGWILKTLMLPLEENTTLCQS